MFWRLLSTAIILFASNPNLFSMGQNASQCGWRPDSEIIPPDQFGDLDLWYNSQEVESKSQEPWLVKINNNRTYGGTGQVVGPRWILTAAHLVKDLATGVILSPELCTVAVGFNRTDTSLWHSVAEIICHPNSSWVTENGNLLTKDDICLIKLNDTLTFSFNQSNPIWPICLLTEFDEQPLSSHPDWAQPGNETGQQLLNNSTARAEVAGYGVYEKQNISGTIHYILPDIPRRGLMRFMDIVYCLGDLFGYLDPATAKQHSLCLWNLNATVEITPGPGDSGSPPIVCPVRNNQSGAVMQRCASLGVLSQTRMYTVYEGWEGAPVKYPRVSYYCGWINETTGGEVNCISPSQLADV